MRCSASSNRQQPNTSSAESPSVETNFPEDGKHENLNYPWTKQWYPLAPIEQLSGKEPYKLTLLSQELVVWKDNSGNWRCFEDRCPHRSAPLSQGRVEPSTGCLMCSYHGWRLSPEGQCTFGAQSLKPDTISNMTPACVKTFPVQELQGLLWVWGEGGPEAQGEAAASPPVVCLEVEDPSWFHSSPWMMREAPISYETLLENGLDVSHAPLVHRDLVKSGSTKLTDVEVMQDDLKGIQLSDESLVTGAQMSSVVSFAPPTLWTSRHHIGTPQETLLVSHCTPVRPGLTRSTSRFIMKDPGPLQRALLRLIPGWVLHTNSLRLQDNDYVLMHEQERNIERLGGWRRSFFLPDPADKAVLVFRKWMERAGPLPFVGGSYSLPPLSPHRELLDHWEQHVIHCPHCLGGLALVRTIRAATAMAGVVLAGVGLAELFGAVIKAALPLIDLTWQSLAPSITKFFMAGALWWMSGRLGHAERGWFFYQDYSHSHRG